jgi:hypothetical protein
LLYKRRLDCNIEIIWVHGREFLVTGLVINLPTIFKINILKTFNRLIYRSYIPTMNVTKI